jgi:hypothetical protein
MRSLLICLLFAAVTTSGAQSAPPRWALSASPAVTIDGTDHEFSRILTVRVPSGEIAVLDGVARELRLFSAAGRFVKRLAGPGAGPGELPPNNALYLLRAGDTIQVTLAPGLATPSVSAYTAAGGFATTTLMRASNAPTGGVSPVMSLGAGRWLARVGTFRELVSPRAAGEITPATTIYGVIQFDGDAGRFRTLDTLKTGSFLSYAMATPGRYSVTSTPYQPVEMASASGGRVWFGDASTGRIRIVNPDGTPLANVPPLAPLRPYDAARVEAAVRRALAGVEDENRRAAITAQFSPAARAPRAPAFTRLVPGANGEMWVELFREDPSAAADFRVLDRDGRVIGAVTIPAGVRVEDVGSDFVLGTIKDADDVPSVVLYQLRRR